MPLPGGPGAYVANGSEHDEIGDTTHLPRHHIRLTERRFKKLELLDDSPYELENADLDVVMMPWGSSKGVAREAYDKLRDAGVEIGWVYSLALNPLPRQVLEVLRQKRLVIVPELNYLGQWSALLRVEGVRAESITQYTGTPFRPSELADRIAEKVREVAGQRVAV